MKKRWYFEKKNYGTIEKKTMVLLEKTMILYRKLCNSDLLWKKLWHYDKKTIVL